MRKAYGLKVPNTKPSTTSPKPSRKPPTLAVSTVTGNVKADKVMQRLHKLGIDLEADVLLDRNPLRGRKPVWLDKVIETLLSGPISKQDMTQVLIKEMGWGKGTASSHVSQAYAILRSMKLVKEDPHTFRREDASS